MTIELHELQELRDKNNRNLCFMVSNDDESKIHDDLINKMSEVQSILDMLINNPILTTYLNKKGNKQ